jgi:hypothetical protein
MRMSSRDSSSTSTPSRESTNDRDKDSRAAQEALASTTKSSP